MFRYNDSVTLPREMTLESAETIMDKITEVGQVVSSRPQFLRRIDFNVEAESEWELRDILADLEQEILTYGGEIDIDRSKVEVKEES